MQRRQFIGFFAGLMPGLPTATIRSTAPATTILIQQSPIAGFQYHHGNALWGQLAIGQSLTLIREPHNRYDKRAVRVDWQGYKLGYVPRAENAAVAQMLDRGQMLQARIEQLKQHNTPWQRAQIAVFALAMPPQACHASASAQLAVHSLPTFG